MNFLVTELLPKADFKFFLSWLMCTIAMFSLSYAFHGLFLNDLSRIAYSLDFFLAASAIVYTGIGLLLTIFTYLAKKIKDSFRYGILIGATLGAFLYAITFVLGIAFNTSLKFEMIAFDLIWQCIEQGFGGLVCGWVYRLAYSRQRTLA